MRLNWLPNAICIGRAVLVGPIVIALLDGRYTVALALIGLAGFSDAVDGMLARNFNWRTRMGEILDPAADKLMVFSVFLTLTYLELVPLFLAVLVISRDLVIIGGAMTYQVLIEPVKGSPALISKLNTGAQFLFMMFALTAAAFHWPPPELLTMLGAIVIFTSITSGLNYVIDWSRRAWLKTYLS